MPLACLQVAPPLLTLFLHPSCSAWSWSYTFLLGTIFAALLPLIHLVLAYAGDASHCTCSVERRAEFSPLGPRAGSFLALGSGLGLVGTASLRR